MGTSRNRMFDWLRTLFVVALTSAILGLALLYLAPDRAFLNIKEPLTSYGIHTGNITTNITGYRSPLVRDVKFKLSSEQGWKTLNLHSPRLSNRSLVFEFMSSDLNAGENTLQIQSTSFFGISRRHDYTFNAAVQETAFKGTFVRHWTSDALEAQDGVWEVVPAKDGSADNWVQPIPGHEGYDRILLVTQPFTGPRRIDLAMTFSEQVGDNPRHGVGVLPLWGGHPDIEDVRPRRGWLYGLAWWYSEYPGFGVEFARKIGGDPVESINSQMDVPLFAQTYHVRVVVDEVNNKNGAPVFQMKMKWAKTPAELDSLPWRVEVRDEEGLLSTTSSYAVGLLAHRAAVSFGPVTVTALN